MSTNALESQGMVIQKSDGASPEVYTTIDEVTSIGGPDGSASEIDKSDLSSTAKVFGMGLKDNGSVALEIMYIPSNTQHAAMRTDWGNRAAGNYKILFTDSPQTTWTFNAYVQNFSISAAIDATLTGSVSLRINGDVLET